jgi:hypothetical protein
MEGHLKRLIMFREKINLRKFGIHEQSEVVLQGQLKEVPGKIDSV